MTARARTAQRGLTSLLLALLPAVATILLSVLMRALTEKAFHRAWGYLLLGFVGFAWFGLTLDPSIMAALSGLAVVYMMFQAPMWCCAENRDGTYCRKNSYGLLRGCSLRQHKWQKIKMAADNSSWSKLCRRVFAGIGGQSAVIGTLAASVSALAAVVQLVMA